MIDRKIAVIGGGICGLTTAIALKNLGIRAEVFEAAPVFRPLGAGLLLAANAVRAFEKIGIAPKIVARGRALPAFRLLDERGKTISEANATAIAVRYGLHNFAIHRAELHEALVSELDPASIKMGKRAIAVSKNGQRAAIRFDDGSQAEADAFIIADGIHSLVRQQFLPLSKPRYAGYACWRGIVEASSVDQDFASETWGKKGRFGIVPLTKGRFYWFACANGPENDASMRAAKSADLLGIFGKMHGPIPQLIHPTPDERILWNDICDLAPLDRFAFGDFLLMGDAAHATTPNLGQGACQAIEDAVVLADELSKNDDIAPAFKAFEKRRLARTRAIVNASWRLGKVAQWQNPLAVFFRNNLLRLVPESVNRRQLRAVLETDF